LLFEKILSAPKIQYLIDFINVKNRLIKPISC
jgi:hypothetical protein